MEYCCSLICVSAKSTGLVKVLNGHYHAHAILLKWTWWGTQLGASDQELSTGRKPIVQSHTVPHSTTQCPVVDYIPSRSLGSFILGSCFFKLPKLQLIRRDLESSPCAVLCYIDSCFILLQQRTLEKKRQMAPCKSVDGSSLFGICWDFYNHNPRLSVLDTVIWSQAVIFII